MDRPSPSSRPRPLSQTLYTPALSRGSSGGGGGSCFCCCRLLSERERLHKSRTSNGGSIIAIGDCCSNNKAVACSCEHRPIFRFSYCQIILSLILLREDSPVMFLIIIKREALLCIIITACYSYITLLRHYIHYITTLLYMFLLHYIS